jgi:hypothetical protein
MDIRSHLQITWASITTAFRLGVIELAANILVQIIGFIIPATIYTLIDVASRTFLSVTKYRVLADSRLARNSCTASVSPSPTTFF